MRAAGVNSRFKHTLLGPGSPGRHSRVILITEVEFTFVQTVLGTRGYATVAVGLLEISADLFEVILVFVMFGPLEIVHHHWPCGHRNHSVRI